MKHVRISHAYCFGLNSHCKKMLFQLTLKKAPPPLIHRPLKHHQRTRINKTMLSAPPPPHRFSTQSLQYQYWKVNTYSILTVTELVPSVSESSTGSQTFEHRFHKRGIENWLPVGFNLPLITTTLCSTTNAPCPSTPVATQICTGD